VNSSRRLAALGLASLVLAGCASGRGDAPGAPMPAERENAREGEIASGLASWYGEKFQGRRTASGERFDMNALTAAHPSLPFGTLVRVRNPRNGREIEVRINDRGPFTGGRIIDLSRAAADAIGLVQAGVGPVILLRP
jgi:rare lipoprotein A